MQFIEQMRIPEARRREPWSVRFRQAEGGFGMYWVHLEDVRLEAAFQNEEQAVEWATKTLGLAPERRTA